MAFNAIIVAPAGDMEKPYSYAAADENGKLVEESFDHGLNHVITANSIYVTQRKVGEENFTEALRDSDVDISVYITDSRVALLCGQYDKGTSWRGGLTALALDAASKAIAEKRTRGKVLVGHIRYEWLVYVGYRVKTGWLSSDQLLMFYQDKEKTMWQVNLWFKKGTDTAFLANDILRRACAYRTAMQDEKTEKETKFFQFYIGGGNMKPPADPAKEIALVKFPTWYKAPSGKDKRPAWD